MPQHLVTQSWRGYITSGNSKLHKKLNFIVQPKEAPCYMQHVIVFYPSFRCNNPIWELLQVVFLRSSKFYFKVQITFKDKFVMQQQQFCHLREHGMICIYHSASCSWWWFVVREVLWLVMICCERSTAGCWLVG